MAINNNDESLNAFEKILYKIIGPLHERGERWRIHNEKLNSIHEHPPIKRLTEAAKLNWARYVLQMNDLEVS